MGLFKPVALMQNEETTIKSSVEYVNDIRGERDRN